MTSEVIFSDKFLMPDVLTTNLMLTGLLFSHFLPFKDENKLDSMIFYSYQSSLTLMCVWLSF